MEREINPDDAEVAFSLPLRSRILIGAVGVYAGLTGFMLLWMGLSGKEHSRTSPMAYLFLGVIHLLASGLFLWASGPRDLRIDMITRRYRRRRGLPGLARWEEGSVDDIARFYVRERSTKQGKKYWIEVAWRDARRKTSWLASYKDSETALTHCRRLGERLGIESEEAIRG